MKPERRQDGAIVNAKELSASDLVHRQVVCPCCGKFVFQKWPEGWDAHAARKCPGVSATNEKERKQEFKLRYGHLFMRHTMDQAVALFSSQTVLIKGGAYPSKKPRGNTAAQREWKKHIIKATRNLQKVKGPCEAVMYFSLPGDRFPDDLPWGTDLDNLAKLVLDSLNETVFREAPGKDSCVVSLSIYKTKAPTPDEVGIYLSVREVPSFVRFTFGRRGFPECLKEVGTYDVL
jgi:Holliday junction resolvase RusA-like endonuclease